MASDARPQMLPIETCAADSSPTGKRGDEASRLRGAPGDQRGYLRVSLAPASREAFHEALARDGQDQARVLRRWVGHFVAGRDGALPVAVYATPWPGASGASPSAYIQVCVDKQIERSFKDRCKILGVEYGKALRAWIEAHCAATASTAPRPETSGRVDSVERIQFKIPSSVRDAFVSVCDARGMRPVRAAEAWIESMADAAFAPLAPLAPLAATLEAQQPSHALSGRTRCLTVSVSRARAELAKSAAEAQGRDLTKAARAWMVRCAEAGDVVGLGKRRPMPEPARAAGNAAKGGTRAAAKGRPASTSSSHREAREGYFDAAVSSELKAVFLARCAAEGVVPSKMLRSWLFAFGAGEVAALPGGGKAPIDAGAGLGLDSHIRARMPRLALESVHMRAGERGQELSKIVRGWMRSYTDSADKGEREPAAFDAGANSAGRVETEASTAAVDGKTGGERSVKVDLPAKLLAAWRWKLMVERSSMNKRGRAWARALVAGEDDKLPADLSLMRAKVLPRVDTMDATIGVDMPVDLRDAFARRCSQLSLGQAQTLRMWIEADVALPARTRFAPADD